MTSTRSRRDAAQQWRHTQVAGRSMASRWWPGPDGQEPGRPIVLVHGLVVSSSYMVPLAERLAADRPVHAPDLPGYGHSEGPDEVLDTRELGAALSTWLDAEGLTDIDLVGNSYGCQVITETALVRPDLVHRLVLLGPTVDPRARRLGAQARRWLAEARTHSPEFRRLMLRDYARAGPRRAQATVRNALRDAIEDRLPFLDMPALVVRGSRDPIVPQHWAAEAASLLPQADLIVLSRATHAVNHEQPTQTARVLRRFLTR